MYNVRTEFPERRKIDLRRWTRIARALLAGLCALAAAGAGAQAAFSPDSSDLWWNAAESGWGMQLVEEGDATFATLFVYDANGMPTFYTATLSLVAAPTWSGDLYRTTGPYFGAASFDPARVALRKVGTLSFTRTSADAAALQYSVDGAVISKSVVRQLLRYDDYSGTYVTAVNLVATHCASFPADRAPTGLFVITVTQTGNTMSIRGAFAHASACTYSGNYVQAGHVGALGASYLCDDGDRGNMNFYEMTRRPGMLAGKLQGHSDSDSCDYSGVFAGLIPM